jgi:hypothetical protein
MALQGFKERHAMMLTDIQIIAMRLAAMPPCSIRFKVQSLVERDMVEAT